MKTLHLEKVLKSNPNIRLFRFLNFSFKNRVQDIIKDVTPHEEYLITSCLEYKKKHDISFWESYIRMGGDINSRLFKHATFHNKNENYIYIDRYDVIDYINNCYESNLALNSQVTMDDGQVLHIPMLDFKIPSKKENLNAVRAVVKNFNLKGSILDSGKSYHFVGSELIYQADLINLLSKFSLLYPISDRAWSSHQIIEASASLRVSKKYGKAPIFIESIDGRVKSNKLF